MGFRVYNPYITPIYYSSFHFIFHDPTITPKLGFRATYMIWENLGWFLEAWHVRTLLLDGGGSGAAVATAVMVVALRQEYDDGHVFMYCEVYPFC